MKASKVIGVIANVLLMVLYILFALTVSCMFEGMPGYSEDQSYLLYMLALWIPLCLVTVLRIIMMLVCRIWDKATVCLASLNAVYIPLVFGLGFIFDLTETTYKVIGICAVVTMILYFVLNFKNYKSNKKR